MFQPRLSLDLVSSSNHISGQIPPDILPDLRSPDSILRDVHDKEILVAKAFNLEEILLADAKEKENQGTLRDPVVVQQKMKWMIFDSLILSK